MNYLLVDALKRHDYFYGASFKVECPTGSGNFMRLRDVSLELSHRLVSVFLPDKHGYRPCHGNEKRYATEEDWNQLILFYEYFNPESGRGCGARWGTRPLRFVPRNHFIIGFLMLQEKLVYLLRFSAINNPFLVCFQSPNWLDSPCCFSDG